MEHRGKVNEIDYETLMVLAECGRRLLGREVKGGIVYTTPQQLPSLCLKRSETSSVRAVLASIFH